MKKIIFSSLLAVLFNVAAWSQAVLPTTWSFTTPTLPTGWSESGTAFYTSSGFTPPTCKFDNTGDKVVIFFASSPGVLTYRLAGNSFSDGTFSVEESIDGVTYTNLFTHTNPPANPDYQLFTHTPLATSRYIRFIYTLKVGGNIGVDDVNIAAGAAGPEQEINVKQGAATIVNGGTHTASSPVSTTLPITFTIENLGTATALNLSSVVIGGPNAADFVVNGSAPTTVAANGTANLVIDFTPAAAGTREATITISNDDADENPYIINLYGIGGSFASEPASQATALVFNNVKTYRLTGSFTPSAASPDGYVVLRKKGSAITGAPADGTVYDRGDIVGDAQVVFSGTQTSFIPNNIIASTGYHFAVFAYNGAGTNRNYLTTAPLTGTVTTPATMLPAGYYSTISTASPNFVTDLHALTNPHFEQYYSNYAIRMINLFEARDTVDNQRVITCVYSGLNQVYTEPFDFTANGFSREHTYCHSWMPINPADERPEYNDYHHLFPTNQNSANAVRSNYPLGKVVTVTSTYLGAKYGQDANGHLVYEPRDEHKGDAARAMLYEAVCYNGVDGTDWSLPDNISQSIPYGQDQSILKAWHFQDLPSSWEISRNDFIDSLQDNRNPFIDNPQYVCFVNFSNMQYETLGCLAGIEMQEQLDAAFTVYPNPSHGEVYLQVNTTTISRYEIIDMQGRTIAAQDINDLSVAILNTTGIRAGAYLVKAVTPYGSVQRSLVIE
jgi:hypothetical protein